MDATEKQNCLLSLSVCLSPSLPLSLSLSHTHTQLKTSLSIYKFKKVLVPHKRLNSTQGERGYQKFEKQRNGRKYNSRIPQNNTF
jgi:hypothetical protein